MYLSQLLVLLPFFTTFGHLNVVKLHIQLERELLYNLLFTTSMAATVSLYYVFTVAQTKHI